MRRLIRCDGSHMDYEIPVSFDEVLKLIGAADGYDAVALRHLGQPLHVMLVDDRAYVTRTETHDMGGCTRIDTIPVKALKPLNPEATRLYHANCHPGASHQIVGDVFVCPDEDFA